MTRIVEPLIRNNMKTKSVVLAFFLVCFFSLGCEPDVGLHKAPKDSQVKPTATATESGPPPASFDDAVKDNPNIPEDAKRIMLRDGAQSGK